MSRVKFAVYNIESRAVLRTGQCTDDLVSHQAGSGEEVVVLSRVVNPDYMEIVEGEFGPELVDAFIGPRLPTGDF